MFLLKRFDQVVWTLSLESVFGGSFKLESVMGVKDASSSFRFGAGVFLSPVETSARQIGLNINNSKTEYIKFNKVEGDLKALNGESLQNVDLFLYLGSWIDCCSIDVNVRIAKVRSALYKLDTIWKSELSGGLKIGFFRQRLKRSTCMDRRLGH